MKTKSVAENVEIPIIFPSFSTKKRASNSSSRITQKPVGIIINIELKNTNKPVPKTFET